MLFVQMYQYSYVYSYLVENELFPANTSTKGAINIPMIKNIIHQPILRNTYKDVTLFRRYF